jgi:ribose transport system substrate-binding protein
VIVPLSLNAVWITSATTKRRRRMMMMRSTSSSWSRQIAVHRVIGGVLLAVVVMIAAGCGADDTGSRTEPGSTKRSGTLAYVTPIRNNEYFNQEACGAKDAADKAGLRVDAPLGPAEWSAPKQIAVLNAALARRPDAVLLPPADPKALTSAVKQGLQEGVPFVSIDYPFGPSLGVTAHVGTNGREGGREAARELIRQLGGRGKVAVVASTPGVQITEDRARGFQDIVSRTPGMTLVGVKYNPKASAEQAAGTMAALLADNKDLAGVFTTNDDMAKGVVTALEEAKRRDVKVIDMDATSTGRRFLETGAVAALVSNAPREAGYVAAERAIAKLRGQPVKKVTQIPFVVINRENMQRPEVNKAFYKLSC